MNTDQKYRSILVSLFCILGYTALIFIFFFPGTNSLGKHFDIFVMLIITHKAGIISGGILLVLRVVKVLKNKYGFLYVFTGLLNFYLALFGIALFVFDQADIHWLHNSLLNLFLGFIIMADILLWDWNTKDQ